MKVYEGATHVAGVGMLACSGRSGALSHPIYFYVSVSNNACTAHAALHLSVADARSLIDHLEKACDAVDKAEAAASQPSTGEIIE